MMRPPEVLTTPRLRLRLPAFDDATAIFNNYAGDPEVTRLLTWPPAGSVEDVEQSLPRFVEAWQSGTSFPWVITVGTADEAVGMIEARVEARTVELGYVLSKSRWGGGYMTEAVQAVTDWAFNEADVWRVWAVTDVENHRSGRVLEKAGFTSEGRLHRWANHPNVSDTPRDVYSYARWRSS